MKYIVSIETDEYEFKDGMTALSFAELALRHYRAGKYTSEIIVRIKFEMEEEGGEVDA